MTSTTLTFTTLLPLLVTWFVHTPDQDRAPLKAIVTEKAIYWRASQQRPMELSLHSVPVVQPKAVKVHEYSLFWTINEPITWHVRDNAVWTFSCHIFQRPNKDHRLYKIPLNTPKTTIKNYSDNIVANRCKPLIRLYINPELPVHFDFVPVAEDRGRLFVLEADRVLTVWEYSFSMLDKQARQKIGIPGIRYRGEWKRVEEFGADFFERFHVYVQTDVPMAITESGELYTIRATRGGRGRPIFQKEGTPRIVAVIEDLRTGKVHAFTKQSCYSLDAPHLTKRFVFPAINDESDETAEILVHAVKFLDRTED